MIEKWKSIEGYEGLYAASNLGNVMSMDYKGSGLPGLLKPLSGTKYPRVCLCKDGIEDHRQIHALVMHAFIGPRPQGMQINHKDGNKRNRALTNLEYCTSAENNQHALDTGLRVQPKGAKHWRAKLTDSKVLEIRAYLAAGMTQERIGEIMNVSQSNVSLIKAGARWAHVKLQESECSK